MRTFFDKENNEWDLTLTVGAVNRVRRLTQIDLLDLTDKGYLIAHHGDPMKTGSIIWALISEQAEKKGVTEENFCDKLTYEACEEAAKALEDSITDFFPESKRHAVIKLLAKREQLTAKTSELVEANLEAIDVDGFAEKMAKEINDQAKKFGR